MPKIQISVRISRATREKLLELAERYGTQAEVIAVAIDRLYSGEVVTPSVQRDKKGE